MSVITNLVLACFRWPVLRCPSLAGFQASPEADRDRTKLAKRLPRSTNPLTRQRHDRMITNPCAIARTAVASHGKRGVFVPRTQPAKLRVVGSRLNGTTQARPPGASGVAKLVANRMPMTPPQNTEAIRRTAKRRNPLMIRTESAVPKATLVKRKGHVKGTSLSINSNNRR